MFQIAGPGQQWPNLFHEMLGNKLTNQFSEHAPIVTPSSDVAFIGFTTWRREENGDANLFDEQVFILRAGTVRPLDPHYEAGEFSPDGLSWGYPGTAPAQLAIAMLMEALEDQERARVLWPIFLEHVITQIPQSANWTVDGATIMRLASALERFAKSQAHSK